MRAVEPYFGGSHRDFLVGLAKYSSHRFTLHTLPGRHWSWRMQGGALALARRATEPGEEMPQLLFCSSMLDLPLYQALTYPVTGRIPTIIYFHENQLTYPLPEGSWRDLGYGWKNVMSAVAADRVLFNSAYHRRDFLSALDALIGRLPDCVSPQLVEEIEAKSAVLPLGCDLRRLDAFRPSGYSSLWKKDAEPLVLWNHRWEPDKAPDEVASALLVLAKEGLSFRVALAGANQGSPPAGFLALKEQLGRRVVHWGKVESLEEYARLLWEADIVVSAARHEFFGQAVVEAIYCGCRPVLPARLSYPEIVPREAHSFVLYEEGGLTDALRRALCEGRPWSVDWQRTWVARFDWGSIVPRYDEEMWRIWERTNIQRV